MKNDSMTHHQAHLIRKTLGVWAIGILIVAVMLLALLGRGYAANPTTTLPPPLSLSELEARLVNPDEVLIATADLEAGMAQLAQQRNEQGLKLFAGAGGGPTTDTALASSAQHYNSYDVRTGLRYPLLGKADAEERGVIEARTSVLEKEQRVRLSKRQCLLMLRRNYITYWSVQERLKLTQSFLAGEPKQRDLLAHRQKAGYLLSADHLEFLSAFDAARRNQENLLTVQRTTLHTIQRLTASNTSFSAYLPALPIPFSGKEQLDSAVIEEYPSVALLRERLHGLEQQVPLVRHAGTNANIDLYTAYGNDDAQHDPEYSVGVNLTVELPIGSLSDSKHPATEAAQALVAKCRRELSLERDNVRALADEARDLFRASSTDILLADQRLRAAAERVRENSLRTAMEGDSLERLQQSRYTYYQVALDRIEAQARQWNQYIALLEFASLEPNIQPKSQPVHQQAATTRIDADLLVPKSTGPKSVSDEPPFNTNPGINSLYVWQSQKFKEQAGSDSGFWNTLQSMGIRRLLFSLNSAQIQELANPAVHTAFADWLRQVRDRGMEVELLLGDPHWILPKDRPKLLEIITALADLPFTGLHLDMEPNQLQATAKQTNNLMKEWLTTVRVAKTVSPWPLGVSLHPRYFEIGKEGLDLGTSLTQLGISEVALMVYVTNPDRVAQLVNPIFTHSPGLKFSLAQSVEPELSAIESHYNVGRRQFAVRMEKLAPMLNQPNFYGFIIQDWTHWQEMKP